MEQQDQTNVVAVGATAVVGTPVFDVAQFEAAETGILDVMNMNDEPLLFNGAPVQIELYGPGSEQYLNAQAEIDRAAQDNLMLAFRGKVVKEDVAAANRARELRKLAACTKALINFPVPGGPASLYANPKLGYITAQVKKFIEDWANFPSPSAQS